VSAPPILPNFKSFKKYMLDVWRSGFSEFQRFITPRHQYFSVTGDFSRQFYRYLTLLIHVKRRSESVTKHHGSGPGSWQVQPKTDRTQTGFEKFIHTWEAGLSMRAFCHTRKSIICALSLNKVNMLVNIWTNLYGNWFTAVGHGLPKRDQYHWIGRYLKKFRFRLIRANPPPLPQLSQHHPYLSVCLSSLCLEGDYMYIQSLSTLADERGGWTNETT